MKILKIGGRNLASLAAPFEVDFEAAPLASSGLFAISGPTGAGKSTLLDALCLALYGATPRLKTSRSGALVPDVGSDTVSSQDPRSLLRRGAGEGHAEVDFVGNDGQRYRARWSVRRARARAAGALQPAVMTLHSLPALLAIGATRTEVAGEIAARIGLSFDQFTRAVLLAQNEFSAFLKTDENERGELLATLTGSVIYSAISRRAYERYRLEQDALRALTLRLADQAPLPADEREALDAASAGAAAALALLDQKQHQLDTLARWQQAANELLQAEGQAEHTLAQARQAVEAAAPRRQHLALIEAADGARPLLAEAERLRREQAALASAQAGFEAAVLGAAAREHDAAQAGASALTALGAAEGALREAAPALDQAKALDAALAVLLPAHAQAATQRDASAQEAATAASAAREHGAALAALRQEHADSAAWLAAHQRIKPLAQQWPRWDRLMTDAEQAQLQLAALDRQRTGAEQQASAAAAAAATASRAAAQAQLALQQALEARQQAIATLARYDLTALRSARQQLAARREHLTTGRALWLDLSALRQRHATHEAQLAGATTQARQAQAALAEADAASAALAAAADQAEASLRAAELACASDVELLRDQLVTDAPCPVCGGLDHPYRDASPALHAVLEQLRGQVTICRAALNANLARQAAESARLAASTAQAAALARDGAALAADLARATALWHAHSAQTVAVDGDDETVQDSAQGQAPLARFDQHLLAVGAQLADIDGKEQAARAAFDARDTCQLAFDQASARHAAANETAAAQRLTAGSAQAALAALADKTGQAAETLVALLDDLEGAFVSEAQDGDLFDAAAADAYDFGFAAAGGWRAAWQADPGRFRARRTREAADFNAEAAAQPERLARLGQLQAQHTASTDLAGQTARQAAAALADFQRHDADVAGRRRQRAALWDGAAVPDVERRLGQAVDSARATLTVRQNALEAARLESARARDKVGQGTAQGIELAARATTAATAVDDWLLSFPASHPALPAPAHLDALAELLAVTAAARQQEQAALSALDQDAASALTIMNERRQRRAAHLAQTPPGDLATLADDLTVLAGERKSAVDSATALRLQVAQDEVRRSDAQAAMAGIERQQGIERRWGRLAELIGSSDGKKFRNYAQQFTLDVLLGYANAHLHHLARRYRLERVGGGNGPSLGLMVRDQDMGGEVRGVNSLSGGESFLVSLALALGLASLSSNRVKVESLFIDEGFGSLDSETLRVAMDALDGLQAMGRKVGVISHVQEMTERIATRIVVQPSGGGSSSVTVE